MKISGIIPLRNAVRLGYPFELAIRSLGLLCDEVVILVDPTCKDGTESKVHEANLHSAVDGGALRDWKIVESVWDMANHYGHTNCEISVQTAKALEHATGDWVLSLQADEVLHEDEIAPLRKVVEIADAKGITGIELERLYFYGSFEKVREDWTLWLLRLFKRGHWKPDIDGAMRFDPARPGEVRMRTEAARIFHYSRIGDPKQVAERVRNLDRFFHAPEKVQAGEVAPYDFGAMRKLDTYVVGHEAEADPAARLMNFPIGCHPKSAREYFSVHPAMNEDNPVRECAGNEGQHCPDCSVPLKCMDDYVGGGSHYWHLSCPRCEDHFTYDTYAFKLRRWPQVHVELYEARDGIVDFVIRNKSTREAVLRCGAVRVMAGGRTLQAKSDYLTLTFLIPPKESRGGIVFEPQDVPDDVSELTFDFWNALSADGESVGPNSIRVSCSDLKRKTCHLP